MLYCELNWKHRGKIIEELNDSYFKSINFSVSELNRFNIKLHQNDNIHYNFVLVNYEPYIAIKIQ